MFQDSSVDTSFRCIDVNLAPYTGNPVYYLCWEKFFRDIYKVKKEMFNFKVIHFMVAIRVWRFSIILMIQLHLSTWSCYYVLIPYWTDFFDSISSGELEIFQSLLCHVSILYTGTSYFSALHNSYCSKTSIKSLSICLLYSESRSKLHTVLKQSII